MKLVKFVPAVAAILVLAACSTATDIASNTVGGVKDAAIATTDAVATATADAVKGAVDVTKEVLTTKTKSVAYKCSKGDVVVAYAFSGDVVKGANVRIGKNTEIKGFLVNAELSKKIDSPSFISGNYVLTVDNGLSFENATKTDLVMLTKKGEKSDEIVAKNCTINDATTKLLNK